MILYECRQVKSLGCICHPRHMMKKSVYFSDFSTNARAVSEDSRNHVS